MLGASTPPCNSIGPTRQSTRACGRRAHGLPDAAINGMPAEASDTGLAGAKIIQSCPTTTDVFCQSRRACACRSRSTPMLSPMPIAGNPPKKSASRTPLSFALPAVSPVTRNPNRD